MENINISIRDGELIAGNRTIKPRSGIISPEMDPYWIYDEMDTIHMRPQDPFVFNEEDKKVYKEVLYPYWASNSLKDFINSKLTDDVKSGVSKNIFKLNQTDKGQGHIIADFESLLNRGLGDMVKEVHAKLNENPDNDFYKAALIVLRASQDHILRYADLAKNMVQNEKDKIRKP